MNWKVLNTEEQYQIAVRRTMEIFHAEEGSPESDELALLLVLIKDYEDRHIHIPTINPIDAIKLKMEERGMKAKDLEPIIGSKGHVSSVLSGRRELTLTTARKLREYFNLPAELFMQI
ncbi:HTH-type transcriptional regulator/antitoxin HigA [Arcticibacter tournemirensis]|uniref:Helix-turn-helix domain-containing protein n=1 Tax=Arcticibacter tournemirensis TaxID=699437 RepID=A0A4Q0MA26_9SPHI|nr:helix-turn-helix domain-containing protein [Arcticibacter tournemirensis]KAA8483728.1 helix-turn-helix domain-containing protein [Arcticibacter tournemirensis]RXF69626.1 helix-turn-helix domain-containing protein [Arcticibacter tournemirensis]TQM50076.1 HTH-type transcriptional regulator/antitoxin HigA [Arcticibacter tournemirensis]